MCIRTFLHSIMHSLIHSRHRMLNLMWKLLEIISCCNIVFTWEHGQYWSKIFHKNRKIARRENRRMAFESDSIRISSIFASSRKRFLNERGGRMVPQWSRLRKFLTLSPTHSPAISSTLLLMYLQRNKRKSRRAAYIEPRWWYQPMIAFAKRSETFEFFLFVEQLHRYSRIKFDGSILF